MLTRTGVVATRILGYSVQGRPITAYQLGDPAAAFTAVVLGSMHGYWEQAGQQVTSAMRSTAIPRGLNLWVIDTVNPDGNALRQRTNAHGVDLNRNWPNKWAPIARGGVFDSHYSGPAALSEPETRAMHTFLIAVRPQRVVSMHQPLNGVDTTDGGAKDVPFRTALAGRLGLPAKPFTCHDVCRGSMTGWLTNYTSTVGITVEFPGAQSAAQSPSTGPSTQYLRGPAAAGVLAALMTGVAVPPPAPPAAPYPRIPPASAAGFVELFYRGVLGHGSAGNPWAPALVAGTKSRTQVATAIAMSTERRNLLVSNAFTRCLGRSSTSPAFVAAFMNGTSSNWAALLGRLAGSGEAFNRAGRNPGRWVDQSYRSILNRSAAPGEQAYWADISARTGLIAAATAIASGPGGAALLARPALPGGAGAARGRRRVGHLRAAGRRERPADHSHRASRLRRVPEPDPVARPRAGSRLPATPGAAVQPPSPGSGRLVPAPRWRLVVVVAVERGPGLGGRPGRIRIGPGRIGPRRIGPPRIRPSRIGPGRTRRRTPAGRREPGVPGVLPRRPCLGGGTSCRLARTGRQHPGDRVRVGPGTLFSLAGEQSVLVGFIAGRHVGVGWIGRTRTPTVPGQHHRGRIGVGVGLVLGLRGALMLLGRGRGQHPVTFDVLGGQLGAAPGQCHQPDDQSGDEQQHDQAEHHPGPDWPGAARRGDHRTRGRGRRTGHG